jgi:hypothetical protein
LPVIQRKVVSATTPGDQDQIATRLATFEERYNGVAEPSDWTFTRDDLNPLLEHLARHDPVAPGRSARRPRS